MSKTQLKTRKIHGRDYVEVNERLKYFRSHNPGCSIQAEIVTMQNDEIVMVAKVYAADGTVMSVGHAHEEKSSSRINNTSYVENCETSAIGRALGILGIGIDGGVATAEEVEMAIAKQNTSADPKRATTPKQPPAKETAPVERQEMDSPEDIAWMAGELFNADAEKINAYLRSIGWLAEGIGFADLPTDKLRYAVDNHEALLVEADKLVLKSDANVRTAVAKSVGMGGEA